MESAKVGAFFSCSFAEDDAEVNDFFRAICEALDITCVNVDGGYQNLPREKAKEFIESSQALVAICVKRQESVDGKFAMPSAVQEEISIAYGMECPILIIVEEGVELDGFKSSYGTYLRFTRDDLYNSGFLEKAIRAIHGLKCEVLLPHDFAYYQDTSEFYAERLNYLFEMKEDGDDYKWSYSSTKRINFTDTYKRSFKTSVWSTLANKIPEDAEKMHWELKVNDSSRNLTINETIEKHDPSCIEASLKVEPFPEEGDYIEYSTVIQSRYLNAVYRDELMGDPPLKIEDSEYYCFDGVIPIQRTKTATVEFRFPQRYGLQERDIKPFVGSYTVGVDYFVESELERTKIRTECFGGALTVRMEIESPLKGHIYGIAWNPKERPMGLPGLEAKAG